MNTSSLKEQQQRKIRTQPGFFAALDQSGGSTPKALRNYGIKECAWSNDKEMFALVHQMRARVITSPSFNGDRIVGTILLQGTMDGDIGGQPTADYLLESEAQCSLSQSGQEHSRGKRRRPPQKSRPHSELFAGAVGRLVNPAIRGGV